MRGTPIWKFWNIWCQQPRFPETTTPTTPVKPTHAALDVQYAVGAAGWEGFTSHWPVCTTHTTTKITLADRETKGAQPYLRHWAHHTIIIIINNWDCGGGQTGPLRAMWEFTALTGN